LSVRHRYNNTHHLLPELRIQAYIFPGTKQGGYIKNNMSEPLHPREQGVIVRNTRPEDVPKVVDLQKESFPYLARYGNIWRPEEQEQQNKNWVSDIKHY
jgi:hypothetical protein